MADVSLFGLEAGSHHLVSLGIHLLAALALWAALRRLTGSVWRSGALAALFAVHPLHVESVAWAAERKDVLSALFLFLALAAWARYVARPGPGRYAPVVLWYVLGLLSKAMIVTFPLVLLALDYWPLGRTAAGGPGGRVPVARAASWRHLVAEKVPLLALSLLFGVLVVVSQWRVGAVSGMSVLPVGRRLANALVSYATYLRHAIWPMDLAVHYPFPMEGHPPWLLAGSALLLGGVGALAWRWRRHRPAVAVGGLWFLVVTLPVSGLLQAGTQALADRYVYLSLQGISLALLWFIPAAGDPAGRRAAGLTGLAVVALALMARRQTATWRDEYTLFSRAAAVTRGNALAEVHLGRLLLERGDEEGGFHHYRRALEINRQDGDLHFQVASLYLGRGREADARELLLETVALAPDHTLAHFNLGLLAQRRGRPGEALDHLRRAIALDPSFTLAHLEAGVLLAQEGFLAEAAAHLSQAARLEPGSARIHYNLAAVLEAWGRPEEADRHRRREGELDPSLAPPP
jgi:Flp pilus assembly protein TadD